MEFLYIFLCATIALSFYYFGKKEGFKEGEKSGWLDLDQEMIALRKTCDTLKEEVRHWYEVSAGKAGMFIGPDGSMIMNGATITQEEVEIPVKVKKSGPRKGGIRKERAKKK